MNKDVKTEEIIAIVCDMDECRRELVLRLVRALRQASERTTELAVKMAESLVRHAREP